jgi:5-methyltetrahydropteroyltriglutamate--homocysteine methyltransferase
VVVGIITSRSGELSPQCGFASTEEGNLLTEKEQWAKLKLVVDVANEVWGK